MAVASPSVLVLLTIPLLIIELPVASEVTRIAVAPPLTEIEPVDVIVTELSSVVKIQGVAVWVD
jgi:hypothetical protein